MHTSLATPNTTCCFGLISNKLLTYLIKYQSTHHKTLDRLNGLQNVSYKVYIPCQGSEHMAMVKTVAVVIVSMQASHIHSERQLSTSYMCVVFISEHHNFCSEMRFRVPSMFQSWIKGVFLLCSEDMCVCISFDKISPVHWIHYM